MTRKLEDLFDLPQEHTDDKIPDTESPAHSPEHLPVMPETLAALDKIEAALPAVRGLEASDSEMDELAERPRKNLTISWI